MHSTFSFLMNALLFLILLVFLVAIDFEGVVVVLSVKLAAAKKSKRKANGKGYQFRRVRVQFHAYLSQFVSQHCCSQHSRCLSSSFSASWCAFDVMRAMHRWGKNADKF